MTKLDLWDNTLRKLRSHRGHIIHHSQGTFYLSGVLLYINIIHRSWQTMSVEEGSLVHPDSIKNPRKQTRVLFIFSFTLQTRCVQLWNSATPLAGIHACYIPQVHKWEKQYRNPHREENSCTILLEGLNATGNLNWLLKLNPGFYLDGHTLSRCG